MTEQLHPVRKIISGGQTGVDRGALDAAMELGIEHGGWCPKGRRAEDGVIPDRYRLTENDSLRYVDRTERNILESEGTLILYHRKLTGGTATTCFLAHRHKKPNLVLPFEPGPNPSVVLQWLNQHRIEILNVAGPRKSVYPGGQSETTEFLRRVFTAAGFRRKTSGNAEMTHE